MKYCQCQEVSLFFCVLIPYTRGLGIFTISNAPIYGFKLFNERTSTSILNGFVLLQKMVLCSKWSNRGNVMMYNKVHNAPTMYFFLSIYFLKKHDLTLQNLSPRIKQPCHRRKKLPYNNKHGHHHHSVIR